MSIKDDFSDLCKNPTPKSIANKAFEFLAVHKTILTVCQTVATTAVDFMSAVNNRSPTVIFRGAFDIAATLIGGLYYPEDFFAVERGWKKLLIHKTNCAYLFNDILKEYPFVPIATEFGQKSKACKIITLPKFRIGYIESDSYEGHTQIYYRPEEINVDDLIVHLMGLYFKSINSNFLSMELITKEGVSSGTSSFRLVAEECVHIKSKKLSEYVEYIGKCVELNINRSLMFYGPPGTGKSSLAQSIVSELKFRTLKIRFSRNPLNLNLLKLILDTFKIEAVIIDDFDQYDKSNTMLELLEMIQKKVKVVIGVANSLREFHPAVLRPGRFDQIVKIDSLDIEAIKGVLGDDLYAIYGNKVKSWPIAYILELKTMSKLIEPKDLGKIYKDLNNRVKKSLADLTKGKDISADVDANAIEGGMEIEELE